ncbi:MAG: beta-lactamase family protein [Anaerolineae bacterium]|nr:beta-lactamase family protein [Anaerolineae bacterium]
MTTKSAAELAAEPTISSNIDLLSAWIEAQMAYRNQPGLSVAVVYDQELVWAAGFGQANVAQQLPATPQTIYRIASITKLFTATAVLQLRDAGKLQLDDPVGKHLPWFNIQNPFADAPPITLRHLLTHTAGLPRESAFPYWNDSNFPSRDEIQTKLPEQTTVLPPEKRWKYSNLGLSLAGEVVTAVSGQPYAEYVAAHILKPLGMADTFVATIDPEHPQFAVGYGRRMPDKSRALSPFTDTQGLTPAANIATTVLDLAKFAMLQFRDNPAGGAQILRGSTLREMQRIHWLEPNWQAGWGLGFRIQRIKGKTYIGHGGSVLGFRTQLRMCVEDKTAVIVFTNSDDGDPLMYVERAYDWVIPALVKAAKPEGETAVPDPAWQSYVGRYRDRWGDEQVLIHDGHLMIIDPTLPDPLEGAAKLVPLPDQPHTFRMESDNGFASAEELAVFELDDSGTVIRLKTGENYVERVEQW